MCAAGEAPPVFGHEPGVESVASVACSDDADLSDEIVTAAQLFRAHAKWVASFTLKLGAAPQAVDDLVQEVFLVAHRRGGYRPGAAKPTTWLAEIAVRVLSTHRRGERRQRVVPDEEALMDAIASGPTPDRTAEGRATLALVERALDELDLGKRAVFVLFELMDESCEDIARGMSIPVGTVHSRLHVARREFQAAFARLESEKRGHK